MKKQGIVVDYHPIQAKSDANLMGAINMRSGVALEKVVW